jgi:hypothetical protein
MRGHLGLIAAEHASTFLAAPPAGSGPIRSAMNIQMPILTASMLSSMYDHGLRLPTSARRPRDGLDA